MFCTRTLSFLANVLSLLHFKSLCVFFFSCLFSTAYGRFGLVRLNLVLKRRFTISSAGVTPVVLWRVVRYLTRNLASLCFIEIPCLPSSTCLTKAFFTTLTDLCGALFLLYFNAIYLFFILKGLCHDLRMCRIFACSVDFLSSPPYCI